MQLMYYADFWYIFIHLQAYSKFLAWLCELEDTSFLRQAIEYMHEIPMNDVINFLIKSGCSASRLINLVSTVIGMDSLNEAEKIKFRALLIGLKMTSCIPRGEQVGDYTFRNMSYLPCNSYRSVIIWFKLRSYCLCWWEPHSVVVICL